MENDKTAMSDTGRNYKEREGKREEERERERERE